MGVALVTQHIMSICQRGLRYCTAVLAVHFMIKDALPVVQNKQDGALKL